jgi:hypothetical protein
LLRTFGKLHIRVSFFYPNAGKYGTKIQSSVPSKNIQKASFKVKNLPGIQPLLKCKKQLLGISLFYQLERILGVQVFFKFTNICNPFTQVAPNSLTGELVHFLVRKLTFFRIQFKSDLYCNTIMFFTHLFKFTKPDGLLFANYLAYVLRFVQRHTYFLVFLKKILQILYRVFKFRGVKILLSGKLNSLTRAQTKQIQVGRVPLQTINIPYIKTSAESFTRAGKIGINV